MARKAGKKGSWLKKLMVFLNLIALLALLAAYAALYIDPRTFWPLAFAGLAYPVILATNLFFVLAWLVTWKKYLFISLIAILAGWSQIMTLFPVRFSGTAPQPTGTMKVISYNIHGFNYIQSDYSDTQRKASRFLRLEQPDFACFQEFKPRGGETTSSFGDSIGLPLFYQKNYLEYRDPAVVFGLAIFTRHPVLQTGYLRDDRNRVFAVWADIRHRTGIYRIYDCHLVSIRFGTKEYSFYEDLKKQETEQLALKEGIFNILRKLKKAFILRSEQTDKLISSIRMSPYPVILAGDLNDSPFSYCYHQLTRTLNDSFREAGKGWAGNTFAGRLPSYRIDYILHGKKLRAIGYTKHTIGYSDHYPVSVTLKQAD